MKREGFAFLTEEEDFLSNRIFSLSSHEVRVDLTRLGCVGSTFSSLKIARGRLVGEAGTRKY